MHQHVSDRQIFNLGPILILVLFLLNVLINSADDLDANIFFKIINTIMCKIFNLGPFG